MGTSLIQSIINDRSLNIDSSLEEFSKKFVSSENLSFQEKDKRYLIKDWYSGYILCFYIGLKKNTRKTEYKRKEKAVRGWVSNQKQYLYLLALMLAKPEIQQELNFNSKNEIRDNIKDMDTLVKSIKKICDQYAFGGLQFLKEKYEKDNTIFDDLARNIEELVN